MSEREREGERRQKNIQIVVVKVNKLVSELTIPPIKSYSLHLRTTPLFCASCRANANFKHPIWIESSVIEITVRPSTPASKMKAVILLL